MSNQEGEEDCPAEANEATLLMLQKHALERIVDAINRQDRIVDDLRRRSLAIFGVVLTLSLFLIRERFSEQEPVDFSSGSFVVPCIFSAVTVGLVWFIVSPKEGWHSEDLPSRVITAERTKLPKVAATEQLLYWAEKDWEDNSAIYKLLSSAYKWQLALSLVSAVCWLGFSISGGTGG